MKNTKFTASYAWMIVFVLGFGAFMYLNFQKPNIPEPEIMQITLPSSSPMPSPLALSQTSGDGTHALAIKRTGELAEIVVNGQMIMSKRVDPNGSLTIPFNAWSPDNKYFFVIEEMGNEKEYLVMTNSGKLFGSGDQYLMIAKLFNETYPDNTILSVSGWAAPTLIILNASSAKETNMSFWFDVQSKKFIRLSTNFY